ncbi:glutamate--cysteine ligase [Streptomyces sp. NPDC006627]|uniref:carboxylate-amine ligase n=1 Tax=Streptomyces sp. NPDC006627 TaxID=3154679 RepID=UPI0033A4D0C8
MDEHDGQPPRFGVEEEYFLLDAADGTVVPSGSRVLRRARRLLGELVSGEFTEYQIEAKTPPCTTLPELDAHLARARAVTAAAAATESCRILASGTPIRAPSLPAPIPDNPRNRSSIAIHRALSEDHIVCATHVHVETPSRQDAVLISNHLRPWLPALIALAANSPFWNGRDTGYASWRTIITNRLPVAGPPPYFTSLAHYETLSETLRSSGTTVDQGTLFWDVRPCAHLPTVEIRAMDVVTDHHEAAALAALIRALVTTALAKVHRDEAAPRPSEALLRAAYWRAARDGSCGHLLDPCSGRLLPADRMLGQLLEYARRALTASGDLPTVERVLQRLATCCGAERQRRAYATHQSLRSVTEHLADATTRTNDIAHAQGH